MGCPSVIELEKNCVFSICTHDPDTGVLTDADAAPAYRVYEEETDPPILTGEMAKLDDDDTTGFYTESIACTAANGFEVGKSYTVYIQATVDSDTGGICYGFTITGDGTDIDNILSLLDDARSEPGDTAPPANPDAMTKLDYIYKFLRNKIEVTATKIHVYNDAGDNKDHTSTISDDGTKFTRGTFASGD